MEKFVTRNIPNAYLLFVTVQMKNTSYIFHVY